MVVAQILSQLGSRIFKARRDTGKTGVVFRSETEITLVQAIFERKAGRDIVVCGLDLKSHQALAQKIEAAVGPYVRGVPHASAGPAALPHFQPTSRPPDRHSLYETPNRKSRKE